MSKKGSLSAALTQFDKRPTTVEDQPADLPEPQASAKVQNSDKQGRAKQPPSRQGKKALTVYFDPEVLKQLKRMAADEDETIQGLVTEALNDFFKKRGKPHIA